MEDFIITMAGVIAGGLISLVVSYKASKKGIIFEYQFEYYNKISNLLYDLAEYTIGHKVNEQYDLNLSLKISRLLNVDYKFIKKIRKSYESIEESVMGFSIFQSECINEIENIRKEKNISNHKFYQIERVREIIKLYNDEKIKLSQSILKLRYDVSVLMEKFL